MAYNINPYNSGVSVVDSEGNDVSGYDVFYPSRRQRYNFMSYDVSALIVH